MVRTCLAWQNVWEVQDEGDCVVSLVWREDGKVSNGVLPQSESLLDK